MKELSLNILDVAENSVRAGAKRIGLLLTEAENRLTVVIRDDGCGMDAETLQRVQDPFYTTRTTRSVGMGLPLYRLAAEQTGGGLTIESVSEKDSPAHHGTTVTAVFYTDHLDFMPLGDMVSTVCTLIQGAPEIDFLYLHQMPGKEVRLDTAEVRTVLGEDIPIDSFEIMAWIRENLEEQYRE